MNVSSASTVETWSIPQILHRRSEACVSIWMSNPFPTAVPAVARLEQT